MDLLNLCITPEDREWRGRARLIEEAIEQVRQAYMSVVVKPVTVRIIVRAEDDEGQ